MYYLKNLATFIFLFNYQYATAQLSESGDLVQKIGQIIDDLPSDTGDDYAAPTSNELTTWEACLLNLLQKKYAASELLANQLAYDLIRFTDDGNNQVYYILQSQALGSNYWGTYVFNPAACQSNLILQAPHPRNDSNTGDQGIYILKEIGALFYMVAGTHRCNSDSYSTCSGTTSTCDNGSESFRASDMAHIDNSIFHKTTELLLAKIIDPYFIQLHGFSKGAADPYLILSNSTTLSPPIDYLSKLGNALVSIDPTLTFEVAHINTSIRLKGTTNTQGRLINGSSDPCTIASPTNTGRFLHIEQERTKLRADAIGWQKMANALKLTFRNLHLGSNPLYIADYGALDTLTAASLIENGTSVIFKSGKLIELKNGFHAEIGSQFLAKIDGCLPVTPLQKITPKIRQIRMPMNTMKIAPNPVVTTTTISYALSESQVVSLSLYNSTGQLTETLIASELQIEGIQKYVFERQNLVEGLYFISLKTTTGTLVEKIMLLKP